MNQLVFKAIAQAAPGRNQSWLATAANRPTLDISIPHEFGGPDSGFSPEDFLGLAAANCFIATFQVFASNSNLPFSDIKVVSTVIIENPPFCPHLSQIKLDVKLSTNPDNHDRAKRLLDKVSKACIVLNGLKAEKIFNFQIV